MAGWRELAGETEITPERNEEGVVGGEPRTDDRVC